MGLVETTDGELPRAPHEGTYVAPSGHRAWFPKGAPLLGDYVPEDKHVPLAEQTAVEADARAEGTATRPRETAAQRRRGKTSD
jgi:hypothetical protein